MRTFQPMIRPAGALAAGCLLTLTAACAGPRVGEVVGSPSSTSLTVQARVVSATPVIGQVTVPRQVCFDELRQEPARSSGAGAILGAIAGGAMGNAVGKGAGKALTTGIGIIGGAVMGDHIENDGRQGTTSTVRRCEQQASYENRVVAYNVVYEYGGQRYSTQMSQEPGSTIPLQVTLTPAVASPAYNQAPVSSASMVEPAMYAPAPTVIYEQPYYPERRHRHWD
jgi:uncharacterized protein YcfJ